MRRADRLFQIIQRLRGRRRAVTAAALAEDLGVSERTVYRDIRDLSLGSGYHPGARKAEPVPPAAPSGEFRLPEEGVNLDDLEQDLIRQAMERTKGVKAHAAALLGLTRDQIRTRLKKASG